ncbi:Aminopeptidase [Balamuthia mandrillaris]
MVLAVVEAVVVPALNNNTKKRWQVLLFAVLGLWLLAASSAAAEERVQEEPLSATSPLATNEVGAHSSNNNATSVPTASITAAASTPVLQSGLIHAGTTLHEGEEGQEPTYDHHQEPGEHAAATHHSKPSVLLPTTVYPVKYELSLQPNLQNFTFSGTEKILLHVRQATNTIVLHAADLEVVEARLEVQTTEPSESALTETAAVVELPAEEINLNSTEQTLTLVFGRALERGEHPVLYISFRGALNDQMAGFYRALYQDDKYMAVTQFEPVDARKAFPCWDEPAIKATFSIALTIPSHLVAISNGPVIQELPDPIDPSLKTVYFGETPKMSTYLVAFVVGEFDFVEDVTAENVSVRVYTPPEKQHLGRFALDVATRTLSYFTEYFGIAYPLPKLDLVAVPDFAAGAMENWGCVTFREALLLIDPTASSLRAKQMVAYVVAHELAHQWFGNLVTMQWWTHLWLNEGFATWVGNLAVDHLFPEWDIWTQFLTDYVCSGLQLDSLESSHAIEVDVDHPAEIGEIFDAISYDKGASVIRMLANYLNEDTFKYALHRYLLKHTYKNAVTSDLWKSLSKASGKKVNVLMNRWVKDVGYPVLVAETFVNETSGDLILRVSQERFLLTAATTNKPNEEQTDNEEQSWWIPLSVLTSENQGQPIVLSLFEPNVTKVENDEEKHEKWKDENDDEDEEDEVEENEKENKEKEDEEDKVAKKQRKKEEKELKKQRKKERKQRKRLEKDQRKLIHETSRRQAEINVSALLKLLSADTNSSSESNHEKTMTTSSTLVPTWIKLNAYQSGFFRVKYSADMLKNIGTAIEQTLLSSSSCTPLSSSSLTTVGSCLSASDRLGVLDDAFALAKAGRLPTTQVLELLLAYRHETSYNVWMSMALNLEELASLWSNYQPHEPETQELMKEYLRSVYNNIGQRLGWEESSQQETEGNTDSALNMLLRAIILSQLGRHGDKSTIAEAKRRFAAAVSLPQSNEEAAEEEMKEPIHPDLHSTVYNTVVKHGGEKEWEAVLRLYREADMHEERLRCMSALGSALDESLLLRALEFSLSDEVRSQDTFRMIASVGMNPKGSELAWRFVQEHYKELEQRYHGHFLLLGRIISGAIANFASEEKAQEVEAFFADKNLEGVERTLQQAVEKIRGRAAWLNRDASQLHQWLQQNRPFLQSS